jgi:hypothetical protein
MSPSLSGGTNTIGSLSTLLTGQTQKITLGGDAADGRGVYRTILSRKLHKTPSLSTPDAPTHPLLRNILMANIHELRESDIFTDGSCTIILCAFITTITNLKEVNVGLDSN